jgi:hypothetical protein
MNTFMLTLSALIEYFWSSRRRLPQTGRHSEKVRATRSESAMAERMKSAPTCAFRARQFSVN